MTTKYLAIISTTLLIISCSKSKWSSENVTNDQIEGRKVKFFDSDFEVKRTLKSVNMGVSEHIRNPTHILLSDSLIVLANTNDDFLINVINLKTRQNHANTGIKGYGPNEIMNTDFSISFKAGSKSVWTYDLSLKRISAFNIYSSSGLASEQLTLKNENFLAFKAVWGSDNSLFAIGPDGQGRIIQYDINGNILRSYGEYNYNKDNKTDYSESVIAQLHQGFLKTNSSNTKVLKLCINLDKLDFVNTETNTMLQISGPDHITPKFSQSVIDGNPILVLDRFENHYTYWDAYLTKNKIYALYSGKKWDGAPTGKYHCKTIYVFSDEGEPLEKITLDNEVTSFTIDEDNMIMYAVSASETPDILVFDLK